MVWFSAVPSQMGNIGNILCASQWVQRKEIDSYCDVHQRTLSSPVPGTRCTKDLLCRLTLIRIYALEGSSLETHGKLARQRFGVKKSAQSEQVVCWRTSHVGHLL